MGGQLFSHSPHTITLLPPLIQPAKDHHKLTCYYYNNKRNSRLLLRPAKVEVVFPEPRIYMLRDVISEPEMARLKELAEPIVRRYCYTDSCQ